jgi:hypothetical protein
VPTRAKRQVRRIRPLGHDAPPVINLLVVGGVFFRLLEVVLARVPAVRVPHRGVDEVRVELRGEARRGHEVVRGGDDVVCALDDEGLLDLAHDGVDGRVEAQRFLDDLCVEGQFRKVLVCELGEVVAEDGFLLGEELFAQVRVLGEAQDAPGDGGRRRVLAGHEKGDHDAGDFVLGDLRAVLVLAVHQVPDHVVRVLLLTARAALAHDARVQLNHGLTGVVAGAVVGEGRPGQHEVDGREAHVEVVVELRELGVERVADLLALERVRGRVDGELGHDLGHVEGALLPLERLVALDKVLDLLRDDCNVRAERFLCEAELDELLLLDKTGYETKYAPSSVP